MVIVLTENMTIDVFAQTRNFGQEYTTQQRNALATPLAIQASDSQVGIVLPTFHLTMYFSQSQWMRSLARVSSTLILQTFTFRVYSAQFPTGHATGKPFNLPETNAEEVSRSCA